MKSCQECFAKALDEQVSCSSCGGASWAHYANDTLPAPPPVEDKPAKASRWKKAE